MEVGEGRWGRERGRDISGGRNPVPSGPRVYVFFQDICSRLGNGSGGHKLLVGRGNLCSVSLPSITLVVGNGPYLPRSGGSARR